MMTEPLLMAYELTVSKQVQNLLHQVLQIYGDESNRVLEIAGTQGDAKLRSFMNWDAINQILTLKQHWLTGETGKFRKNHPAIGAGVQQ
jgi:hypothetical protein